MWAEEMRQRPTWTWQLQLRDVLGERGLHDPLTQKTQNPCAQLESKTEDRDRHREKSSSSNSLFS